MCVCVCVLFCVVEGECRLEWNRERQGYDAQPGMSQRNELQSASAVVILSCVGRKKRQLGGEGERERGRR